MRGGARWRLQRAATVLARVFHRPLVPLLLGAYLLLRRAAVGTGQVLDRLFWPGLRAPVTDPVVIVGNPRSGTTFLHRFLGSHGLGSAQPLIRLLVPSLTLQALLRPFLPALERFSPARFHAAAAHETSLTSAEADDVSLMFHFVDGFFLYGFILAFDDEDHQDLFRPDVRDTDARDFRYWEGIWRRGRLADRSARVLPKLFSLGARAPAFFRRFPEGKIIYMVRDPLETIPSGMSLVTTVLHGAFGFWSLPDDVRRRYLDRLYQGLVALMLRWTEDWQQGHIPRDRVLIVRYDRMMSDFSSVMSEIFTFLGEQPSPALAEEITALAARQRAYKSRHTYDLARFGLDEARIRQDCAAFYERWLPSPAT